MKNALVLATLSLLALPAPLAAQTPPPPQATTLSLSAEGRVERAPDVADMSAGVVTQAGTASAALAENSTRMARVVAALKTAGVAERDIQTSGISLHPQYRYGDNQPPQLIGYQASNNVNVRVRDLARMGRVIDTLVAQGANQINGPSFQIDKPDAALDEARTAAVQKAVARANLYARAAGMKIRRIVQITEGGGYSPPVPMPIMARAAMAETKADSTPVAPGEVALTVSVNMTFELE